MSWPFDPDLAGVVVPVWLTGPVGTFRFKFRVDTGADRTMTRPEYLDRIGYPASPTATRVRVRSATGGAAGRIAVVSHVLALGRLRAAFPVVVHDFPPTVTTDGLLGLDFFRGHVLTIDFARNRIALAPPRRWWRPWD